MPRNQLQVENWGRTVAGRDAHGLGWSQPVHKRVCWVRGDLGGYRLQMP